jgi:hypothetical protein
LITLSFIDAERLGVSPVANPQYGHDIDPASISFLQFEQIRTAVIFVPHEGQTCQFG